MAYLYKFEPKATGEINNNVDDIEVKVFVPSIWTGLYLPGEEVLFKTLCVRILFQLMTLGKAKLFYVMNESEKLMHTSYLVPACAKFPFMNEVDYEIGPCLTYPDYRGQGIYPRVLRSICNKVGENNSVFYMIVDEFNKSSIRGIEKAGFIRCGTVQKSKFTKRYFKSS